METTIQVRFIEQKTSKVGKPYWAVEDVNGNKYSCFGKIVADGLRIGQQVKVNIEEKGQYKNITEVMGVSSQPTAQTQLNPVVDAIKGIIISRTERANSYEFGKAGNRHKVFYETIEELKEKVTALQEAGFSDDFSVENVKISDN